MGPSNQSTRSQVVHLREGALAEAGGILDRHSAQRVFLVVDEPAYIASGGAEALEPVFRNRIVSRFTGFEPNPKLHDIERGLSLIGDAEPDVVIGFGGGTAIDLAKLIGSLAVQSGPVRSIITGRIDLEKKGLPLIAVPTTSGTGSEATHFAVAYVDGQKHSLAHPWLLPDYALVDAKLTASLPAHITSVTGLDAFCQAVESLWAVGATDESVDFAAHSLRLSVQHLEAAVLRPTASSRLGMCEAAHLAGKAINISKTTASHALSYAITSDYGVAHGAAVALSLGAMLEYNAGVTDADCTDPRGAEFVRGRIDRIVDLLGAENVVEARRRIDLLIEAIHCPVSLSEVGIKGDAAIEQLVDRVNLERLANNPRKCTSASLCGCLSC